MLRNAKRDFLRCIGYLSFTKKTYKAQFIANSSSCTTTELSKLLTSCLTLYTTLPHNLIKEKLINLIEWTFKREGSPYIACNEKQAFFTSEDTKRYKLWSCQNVCEALIYLWIIFISDLALSYTEKLLVFRWVLIVLLL